MYVLTTEQENSEWRYITDKEDTAGTSKCDREQDEW